MLFYSADTFHCYLSARKQKSASYFFKFLTFIKTLILYSESLIYYIFI